jgi:phosphoribosylformylglycinamidine synthase
MAASALDLAVRRAVCTGADPAFLSALDNFCWPNVVKEAMPERSHKLAQLVRACEGLADTCRAFGVPLISGKDSMSNDCTLTDPPISVPPTLLVSVVGRLADVAGAVTLDPKRPGDLLYVLGQTHEELGGSELYRYLGQKLRGRAFIGNAVPRVDAPGASDLYRRLHTAISHGLVRSCHTPALGGLAAALARKALAGGWGLELELARVPGSAIRDETILYSESNSRFLVTVAPDQAAAFEQSMAGSPLARAGRVRRDRRLVVRGRSGRPIIRQDVEGLRRAWKETTLRAG